MIDNTNSDRLMLALEPEVAAIYCRSLNMSEFSGDKKEKDLQMTPNTTYMIVDAGGMSTLFIWGWFLSDTMCPPPPLSTPHINIETMNRINLTRENRKYIQKKILLKIISLVLG